MSRITIDPVTRIEGHLRIDAEVDGGVVRKAWSSGQMFRGIERILQGRDPREAWLFTQRFCGVCTTVHAIASVRAVENALQLEVPLNAQYIRNIIVAAHAMHDHIVHFYHLSALDWVDVVSALKADPAKTSALAESLSTWPGNGRMQLTAVRDRLKGFVDNGQLGIFQNGYWGHPAMKLSPEVNLLAVSHYLEALEYQRKINQVVAILGGKTPNIQNLAVGGVANAINLDNQATLNMDEAVPGQGHPRRDAGVHPAGLLPGRVRHRRDVRRLVRLRQGGDQLPVGARSAARHQRDAVRLPGRRDHERRPRARPGDQDLQRAVLPRQRDRVDRAIVVRRQLDAAPVRGRHRAEVRAVPGQRQVLVGQGAALQGHADAGRAARAGADRLRARAQADRRTGPTRRWRRRARSRRRR